MRCSVAIDSVKHKLGALVRSSTIGSRTQLVYYYLVGELKKKQILNESVNVRSNLVVVRSIPVAGTDGILEYINRST